MLMCYLVSCSCRVRVQLMSLCSSACRTQLFLFLTRADCDHDSQTHCCANCTREGIPGHVPHHQRPLIRLAP
jgi:hypothetical protein